VVPFEDGTVALKASNGKYLSRINRGEGLEPIEAAKESVDIHSRFKVAPGVVTPQRPALESLGALSSFVGEAICLQGDNGKFLSRINRGDLDPIEAIKSNVDWHCLFHLEKAERGVCLKADNGKYISRINRGFGQEPMIAAKNPADCHCDFEVVPFEDGTVALKGSNGKFLSRINRGEGLEPIEAAKESIDIYSRFKVVHGAVVEDDQQRSNRGEPKETIEFAKADANTVFALKHFIGNGGDASMVSYEHKGAYNALGALTITFWAITKTPDYHYIVSRGDWDHEYSLGVLASGDPKGPVLRAWFEQPLHTTTRISPNTWFHVAFVYSGVNISLYLNGVLEASKSCHQRDSSFKFLETPLRIGGEATVEPRHFLNGELRNFRILSSALSPGTVAAEFARGVPGAEFARGVPAPEFVPGVLAPEFAQGAPAPQVEPRAVTQNDRKWDAYTTDLSWDYFMQ